MATIATFVNATAQKYVKANLNPKRQRLMRLLAKAASCHLATSGIRDYISTAARVKALITDTATLTIGMTPDQVEAARIASAYGAIAGSGVLAFPDGINSTVAANMASITPWLQLDEATLDRMELVLEYFATGQS